MAKELLEAVVQPTQSPPQSLSKDGQQNWRAFRRRCSRYLHLWMTSQLTHFPTTTSDSRASTSEVGVKNGTLGHNLTGVLWRLLILPSPSCCIELCSIQQGLMVKRFKTPNIITFIFVFVIPIPVPTPLESLPSQKSFMNPQVARCPACFVLLGMAIPMYALRLR